MKKNILFTITIVAIALLSGCNSKSNYSENLAITGATPIAIEYDVPSNKTVTINGLVKKEYVLDAKALNSYSKTRIRTKEISPEGKFIGTYIYNGIPLYNILEGIAPKKPKDAVYDRPLDIVVEITSASGKKVQFSYGELTMTDDNSPVTLAFHREELLPHKEPEKYTKNISKGGLTGLKIIAPREYNTARYLDNVKTITFTTFKTPDLILPKLTKGSKCSSSGILFIKDGELFKPSYKNIKIQKVKKWIRVGHGRGFKGVSTAEGYNLKELLKKNFPNSDDSDYFMFIGCDGYRSLFSGKEIFSTRDGNSYMIVNKINGKKPRGNQLVAPVDDYYLDRAIWSLTHIVLIKK